jgi:hypothetical protein
MNKLPDEPSNVSPEWPLPFTVEIIRFRLTRTRPLPAKKDIAPGTEGK